MNKTKTTKNTITIKPIKSKSVSEIDFEMYEDILGKEDADEAYEGDNFGVNIIDNTPHYYNLPMKIDDVISILNKLKEKGSNYVSIDYGCDHFEYTFEGYKICRATEKDLEEEEEREKLKTINEANELRKRANELIEQAQKILKK